MIGEIGGDVEERAAEYIKANVTKPVVGYVAGFTAPEGKTMGHAGAIVSGSSGTAQAKKETLSNYKLNNVYFCISFDIKDNNTNKYFFFKDITL